MFLVRARMLTVPLVNLDGEAIIDTFYSDELQFVMKPNDALFTVEHILKTRRQAGKVEYLVKWHIHTSSTRGSTI